MPNKNNFENNFHYYDQAQVQDVTFGGYEVTSRNPGSALIYSTILVNLILFLIGMMFIPGSPIPIQKFIESMKERISDIKHNTAGLTNDTNDEEESSSSATNHDYILRAADVDDSSINTRRNKERQKYHTYSTIVTVVRTGARGKKKRTLNSMQRRNNTMCVVTVQKQQQIQANPHNNQSSNHAIQEEVASVHKLIEESSNYEDLKQGASDQNPNVSELSTDNSSRLTFNDLWYHMTHFNSVSIPSTHNKQVKFADSNKLGEKFLDDPSSPQMKNKPEVDISTLRNEMRVIMKWAAPWALQSAVSYGEDIATIVIISHFMGLRAMLCYSNVWFIVKLMHIVNDAWYSAVYKYINVACAKETNEACISAGRLISLGMMGNVIMSIPFSIITVRFMPDIMELLGYEESIVSLSQGYALIAVINHIVSSTSDILASILDLEGYAKFNAVFDFWTSLCDLIVVFIFVLWWQPSLKALGVCHLILDLISTGIFYYLTFKKGCFEGYTRGMFRCSDTSAILSDLRAVGAATIPLTGQEIIENTEYIVFTIFAAYQGPAEVATWILISYVWDFVELLSESFAEAAAYKISRHIARGKLDLAQAVSFYTIKVGILINVICSFVIYLFGPFFVWCLSLDSTLEQMLLEVIPYVVTCQPFIAVGMIATEILNEALFIYKKATVTLSIATIFIMIPIAAIATYWFHFNIEGLASAQCIGHTAAGVASIVLFMNADWDRALQKAQRKN